jgi:hypothetical protein
VGKAEEKDLRPASNQGQSATRVKAHRARGKVRGQGDRRGRGKRTVGAEHKHIKGVRTDGGHNRLGGVVRGSSGGVGEVSYVLAVIGTPGVEAVLRVNRTARVNERRTR